nr:transporter [Bernardetiaceae bacterium]
LNSRIYVLPDFDRPGGGPPRLVTEQWPSYWHGISPDGQTLLYCARRQNQWDVYRIGVNGGPETRLTDAPGLDDGPEYSPDGQWIYFNSHRTGRMHLYRWFAHPAPTARRWPTLLTSRTSRASTPSAAR